MEEEEDVFDRTIHRLLVDFCSRGYPMTREHLVSILEPHREFIETAGDHLRLQWMLDFKDFARALRAH